PTAERLGNSNRAEDAPRVGRNKKPASGCGHRTRARVSGGGQASADQSEAVTQTSGPGRQIVTCINAQVQTDCRSHLNHQVTDHAEAVIAVEIDIACAQAAFQPASQLGPDSGVNKVAVAAVVVQVVQRTTAGTTNAELAQIKVGITTAQHQIGLVADGAVPTYTEIKLLG